MADQDMNMPGGDQQQPVVEPGQEEKKDENPSVEAPASPETPQQ